MIRGSAEYGRGDRETLPSGGSLAAPSEDADLLGGMRAAALIAALILAVLCFQLNATMVTPILPEIAAAMKQTVAGVAQVSSLFFLTGAVAGVVLSRWSDLLGRRRVLLGVLVTLSVGSLVCAFANDLPMLLFGRVLQGVSSAVYPLAYMILKESIRRKLFGVAMGSLTAISGGVGGLDGIAGGLLGEHFGFRAVFLVILLTSLLASGAAAAVLPKTARPSAADRMDWWGAAALSAALVGLSLFISLGAARGWVSPAALGALAGGAAATALFAWIERGQISPLIAPHHLRSRPVWSLILTTVLTLSGIFAVSNFTVVMLSRDSGAGFGLSAAAAALLFLTPAALIGVISAPFAGWLAGKRGWIQILRFGLLLSTLLLLAIAAAPRNEPVVMVGVALLGFTYYGLTLTTLNGLGVLMSPADAPATLPGLNGAAFGIGAGLGIGLVAPFAGARSVEGYSTALWISVGISVLALIASAFIRPQSDPPT